MEREESRNVVNNFESGSNCQVFNGPVSGCVFAMPGSSVTQQAGQSAKELNEEGTEVEAVRDEELFHFVHPELDDREAWHVHDAVKRLVKRQGIQGICKYLHQMREEKKILLPESPGKAYGELVRLGMSNGEGFNPKTFQKYYRN